MFESNVVVVDVETTDLDPHNRLVWDVGMVVLSPDLQFEQEHQFFVELTEREIKRANPESLDIGGFDDRYNVYEALGKNTAAGKVLDITTGNILAGICVDFDAVSLENLLTPLDKRPAWNYHLLDIRTLAIGYVFGGMKGNENYEDVIFPLKQDDVARMLGVEPISENDRHTAIGDARFGAEILRAVLL